MQNMIKFKAPTRLAGTATNGESIIYESGNSGSPESRRFHRQLLRIVLFNEPELLWEIKGQIKRNYTVGEVNDICPLEEC